LWSHDLGQKLSQTVVYIISL